MIQNIFGWIWTAIGTICILFPKLPKAWIGRKTGRKISWPYLILVLMLFIQGICYVWSVPNLLIKIVMFIGLFTLFKLALSFKTKMMNIFFSKWSRLPDGIFRSVGILILIWGVYLLRFTRF